MNSEFKSAAIVAAAFVIVFAFSTIAPSLRSDDDHTKVEQAASQSAKAAKVFDAIMQAPDKSIPKDLLARAKAVAVFPQVIKASFVVGAEGGRGVVTTRTSTGWSEPVFFRAGGGSVGWQIGASATDFVLLFMNDDALSQLAKDRFELGAEADVTGGPVGREAGAETDALMHAEILSYSRSQGLFAGVSLKGVVVRPEDDLNEAVYHERARELFGSNDDATSQNAALGSFTKVVAQYTSGSKSGR